MASCLPRFRRWVLLWSACTLTLLALGGADAFAYTFTPLDGPGASATNAYGINALGQIVGAYVGTDGLVHGFVREPEGTFTTIDAPGAFATSATDINEQGQIVGFYFDGSSVHGYLAVP